MSEQSTTSINVSDLDAAERHALEAMLQSPLEKGQSVLILTYTPTVSPPPEQKAHSKVRIEQILEGNRQSLSEKQVSDDEFNAAVHEACEIVRRGKCES